MLKKFFLITLISLSVLLLGVNLAWAVGGNTIDQEKRLMIIHMSAYGMPEISGEITGETTYNKDFEQKYLSMSDKEFEKALRDNLESIIIKKDEGVKINWDRDFAEKVVKNMFPDLYTKIDEQIENDLAAIPKDELEKMKQDIKKGTPPVPEQPVIQEKTEEPLIASYVPGSNTVDFVYVDYGALGEILWKFHCQMYWVWDATKITTVIPSTWGQLYDPIWYYDGIKSNTQYYINPTSFYKHVVGKFHSSLGGYIIQYGYPWHIITVYAGGTWTNSMGMDS
jgi:hypothetical protein